MIFPWQQTQWESLQKRIRQNNLPHAILLTGPQNSGKNAFAEHLARILLCETPHEDFMPCGACRSCRQFASQVHPDYIQVKPEESSQFIKIDQIRAIRDATGLATHYGRYRVISISPADKLNKAAANSLLKTLEEPPADTVLVLTSSFPAALPATIRSRCQSVILRAPNRQQAHDWLRQNALPSDPALTDLWLNLSHGSPLLVEHWMQQEFREKRDQYYEDFLRIARDGIDPVSVVQAWQKQEIELPLRWMYTWVSDMIRIKSTASDDTINQDKISDLRVLAQNADLKDLYVVLDKVTEAMRLAHTSINNQLLLEDIFIHWQRISYEKQRVINYG